jgi:hypothetical protein
MLDRRFFLTGLAAAVLAPAVAAAKRANPNPAGGAPYRPPPEPRPQPPKPEPERREDLVDLEALRAAWKDKLVAARQTQIERVRAYRKAARFPHNTMVQNARVPVFVDKDGRLCAVAHLMTQDGLGNEVRAISQANNFVRVMEVQSGPLVDWVLRSGLLQEEAALIQPSYDWREPIPEPIPEQPKKLPDVWVKVDRAERIRIQNHLASVLKQLKANTDASIEIALDRLVGPRPGPA